MSACLDSAYLGRLAMYELFDHTADLGLRAIAPSLEQALQDVAMALTAAIVAKPESLRVDHVETIRLTGDDLEYLAFDWLRELLDRFERGRVAFRDFQVERTTDGLAATCSGQAIDDSVELEHEVKAITYHGLRVERVGENWIIEAVVDI